MATDIVVPRLGATVTEVTLLGWLVPDGALVASGDPVVSVETDKVETELEAPVAGHVRQLKSPQDGCPVGSVIGHIE